MSILFISDIHLCIKKPEITKGFLNFLCYRAAHAKALYILGDLFETWLGDDNCNLFHMNIARALKALVQKNVSCYFIHGNRDFLLGKKYANLCGMILLPALKILKLSSGKKIILLHGDTLCIDDISYQRYRKFLRSVKIKKIFLSLPLSIRLYIVHIIRSWCIQCTNRKKNNNLNVNSKIVAEILIKNKAEIMIHGHTHQLAIHKIYNSKKDIFSRIVLGSWNKYGSMIEINDRETKISIKEFPLN